MTKPATRSLNVTVEVDLVDRLTAQADREDRTTSRVVARALTAYLELNEPADQKSERMDPVTGGLA